MNPREELLMAGVNARLEHRRSEGRQWWLWGLRDVAWLAVGAILMFWVCRYSVRADVPLLGPLLPTVFGIPVFRWYSRKGERDAHRRLVGWQDLAWPIAAAIPLLWAWPYFAK